MIGLLCRESLHGGWLVLGFFLASHSPRRSLNGYPIGSKEVRQRPVGISLHTIEVFNVWLV
ncbi:MAG: hypothetical protein NT138_06160 [Planctomycetales bacterium]|nr:hypothetical protein [Planctomycetales bacterium]